MCFVFNFTFVVDCICGFNFDTDDFYEKDKMTAAKMDTWTMSTLKDSSSGSSLCLSVQGPLVLSYWTAPGNTLTADF